LPPAPVRRKLTLWANPPPPPPPGWQHTGRLLRGWWWLSPTDMVEGREDKQARYASWDEELNLGGESGGGGGGRMEIVARHGGCDGLCEYTCSSACCRSSTCSLLVMLMCPLRRMRLRVCGGRARCRRSSPPHPPPRVPPGALVLADGQMGNQSPKITCLLGLREHGRVGDRMGGVDMR